MIKKSPLSWLQVSSIAMGGAVGMGILTLSRTAYDKAGSAGIIAVMLAGLALLMTGFVMIKIALLYPSRPFFAVIDILLGRYLGFFLKLYYTLYFILLPTMTLRLFAELIDDGLLSRTPTMVVMGVMLLSAVYAAFFDVQVLGRVNQIIQPFMFFLLILFLAISLVKNANFLFLLPLEFKGREIMQSSLATAFTYAGFEFTAFLLSYMQSPREGYKAHSGAVIAITFLYVFVVFAGIACLGEDVLSHRWPTLEVIRIIEIPITFLERFDAPFITVWVFAVFTTVCSFLWLASRSVAQLFKIKNARYPVLPVGIAMLWLASLPPNMSKVDQYADFLGTVGLIGSTLIPLCLYFISLVRGVRHDKKKPDN